MAADLTYNEYVNETGRVDGYAGNDMFCERRMRELKDMSGAAGPTKGNQRAEQLQELAALMDPLRAIGTQYRERTDGEPHASFVWPARLSVYVRCGVLCPVIRRLGTHDRPADSTRLQRVLDAVRAAKIFVLHEQGRAGFSAHPIVPRSPLRFVSPQAEEAKIIRHLLQVATRQEAGLLALPQHHLRFFTEEHLVNYAILKVASRPSRTSTLCTHPFTRPSSHT